MSCKPRKIGERMDAARYVIQVVVEDVFGGDCRIFNARSARELLARMNGISLEAAQVLLDQANQEYDEAQLIRRRKRSPSGSQSNKEVRCVLTDFCTDDTVIE
jgi:hypothetical protein